MHDASVRCQNASKSSTDSKVAAKVAPTIVESQTPPTTGSPASALGMPVALAGPHPRNQSTSTVTTALRSLKTVTPRSNAHHIDVEVEAAVGAAGTVRADTTATMTKPGPTWPLLWRYRPRRTTAMCPDRIICPTRTVALPWLPHPSLLNMTAVALYSTPTVGPAKPSSTTRGSEGTSDA